MASEEDEEDGLEERRRGKREGKAGIIMGRRMDGEDESKEEGEKRRRDVREAMDERWIEEERGGGIDRKGRSVKALDGVDVRWAGART